MKRIVSLILVLSMVLSMFSMSFAGLKDVEGTEYEAAVNALIELGVVNGYPDGTFLPDNVVTRAELAKLLVVAYGLEPAAEASKGATAFSDVGAEHWASGYVNVSADYKFVNGYPEGTFKGDATVTYAEAITMCLRVLGYANEIDSKGTWPTNYIAKAQDLGLMEGIDFGSYNDGAKRGNVALLIWNMLRTPMWEVTGESEGDGLQSNPNRFMLNVKFSDYAYDEEAIFNGFSIVDDTKNDCAKVTVNVSLLTYDARNDEYVYVADNYDYYGNDFYTFVPGTEVEVLVNVEDDAVLTMVATGEDKLVEGKKDDIDEDYDELSGDGFDYAYARVETKKIEDATMLVATSMHIDEITEKKDYVSIDYGAASNLRCDFDEWDYNLILKDGERLLFSEAIENGDIAVGDILTTVTVIDYATDTTDTFYVVGGSEIEGEFEIYEAVEFENSDYGTFEQLTIDGDEYPVDDNAMFVEDPEDEDPEVEVLSGNSDPSMKGEEVLVKLDGFFGKVVRIEFDGKIDAGEDTRTSVQFVAIGDNDVDRNSDKRYFFDFLNENGPVDEIPVKKNSTLETAAKNSYIAADELTGNYVAAVLNEDDELVDVVSIVESGEFVSPLPTRVLYGDSSDDEYYAFMQLASANYDDEKTWFMTGTTRDMQVTDDTVLVRVVVDDEEETITVEFESGLEAVEKEMRTSQDVVAIYDQALTRAKAKYLVVVTDGSDNSDYEVAKVDKVKSGTGIYVGDKVIVLEDNDEEIIDTLLLKSADENRFNDYKLVVYTVTTKEVDDEEERTFNFKAGLVSGDLISGEAGFNALAIVEDPEDDGTFYVSGDTTGIKDLADYEDNLEDAKIILVHVDDFEVAGTYEVSAYEEVSYEGLNLKDEDRIYGDLASDDVIFIIRGIE